MPAYYPIFLDLTERRCVAVGGGLVAERKVQGLLEARARVWVVSPALTDALGTWAANGALTHLPRTFHDDDVEGCALGKSPMLAKRSREGLEACIGPEYGELVDVLGAMRAAVRYRGESSEVWRAMFQRVIDASCLPLLADATTAALL